MLVENWRIRVAILCMDWLLLVFWVEGEDETVDVLDERIGEGCANFLKLGLEFWAGLGLVMKRDDELGKGFVAKSSVVVDLLGDFGNERQELEIVEVSVGHDGTERSLVVEEEDEVDNHRVDGVGSTQIGSFGSDWQGVYNTTCKRPIEQSTRLCRQVAIICY